MVSPLSNVVPATTGDADVTAPAAISNLAMVKAKPIRVHSPGPPRPMTAAIRPAARRAATRCATAPARSVMMPLLPRLRWSPACPRRRPSAQPRPTSCAAWRPRRPITSPSRPPTRCRTFRRSAMCWSFRPRRCPPSRRRRSPTCRCRARTSGRPCLTWTAPVAPAVRDTRQLRHALLHQPDRRQQLGQPPRRPPASRLRGAAGTRKSSRLRPAAQHDLLLRDQDLR